MTALNLSKRNGCFVGKYTKFEALSFMCTSSIYTNFTCLHTSVVKKFSVHIKTNVKVLQKLAPHSKRNGDWASRCD